MKICKLSRTSENNLSENFWATHHVQHRASCFATKTDNGIRMKSCLCLLKFSGEYAASSPTFQYICSKYESFMDQLLTIYKASAGSGKTFTLTVEYILGLLHPHAEKEFEHTLAVTFTNKATAEMKSRILETLYGLKMRLKETQPYLDAVMKRFQEAGINYSEEQICTQAGKALTAILHDYSQFRVGTIDSFFQSILRNMARELGLAANLQVELSHEEIIDSAVESLILTMDSQPQVKKWVMDSVREQLDSGDKWDIVGPLKKFAGNIFTEEYQQRSEEDLARISDSQAMNDFKRKMQDIKKQAVQEVQTAADNVISQFGDFDGVSYGDRLLSFLLKARAMESEGPSATIQGQADGSKSLYKKQHPKNGSAIEDELRTLLADFIQLYAEKCKDFLSATLALRHLGPLRLLKYIDERAREIEGDAGRFTLSSTPALLSKMVEGSDTPFIFEKIGTHINNVMIDEFQDTSRMQWENFKKLLFEKLASGGKGLLVGDIKQSIYRWRGGDWKILYGIEKEKELQGFNIKAEPLGTNYRSHQVIVDFNKMFFPEATILLDGIVPNPSIQLDDIYKDVGQEAKKADQKGYVKLKLFKTTDDYVQDTIIDMAEQIRTLQSQGLELDQIAILVRTNGMAQQLVEGFGQHASDIRLVSDEAFLLKASISIQMIVAALRILIDKQHTDIVSEKFLMLHYLKEIAGQEETSLQSLDRKKLEDVLPEEFTAHRDELVQMPLYLLTEKIWNILALNKITGEDIYVLTFFDELQSYLRTGNAPDIQSFLDFWDEKLQQRSVPGSSVTGVRILTIHKSKGLEFHTVLLPFSDWLIEKDRKDDMLWCSANSSPWNELGKLPISIFSKDVRTSVFSDDYEKEHLERRVDALNTLYVAFTRPKANLYVWGKGHTSKDKGKFTTASELIHMSLRNNENDTSEDVFTYEIGSPLVEASKKEEEKTANRLCLEHKTSDAIDVAIVTTSPALNFLQSRQSQDYLQQLNEEGNPEEGSLKLSQREIGKRMHEVLSRIDDVCQLDEVLHQAQEEGIIGDDEDWTSITTHIKEGFQNPLVTSWFQSGNTIYNECAIASIDKANGLPCVLRPDRVIVNGNSITVVDYKFGHPSRLYHQQVETYMKLMREMYPHHDVQGYLWYIMGKGPVPVKPKT